MKRWDKDSERVYLCECSLPSYIPHLSLDLEKNRRLSVLWRIWNFSMISAEKVPGSFDLSLSSPWSGFCVQKRWPKEQLTRNASVPKFEKLQSSFATDLYHYESCLIKLALEKLNRRQQLLDREAIKLKSNLLTVEFVTSRSSPKTLLSQEKQNGLYLRPKNYDWLTGQFSAVNAEV